MKILAIETSCDETSAAVVEKNGETVTLLSNVVATSLHLHAQTGGIIPEVAARNQIHYIVPVIAEALEKADINFDVYNPPEIDALAVTYGPGLIGSLLVGVETVKTLAYLWNKPLIPVNHLFGHIYANWLKEKSVEKREAEPPQFPLIALIVSGGHTDLLLMKNHTDITWLGGTRDDAAGEAFDKVGRLLNLSYPAGPKIEQLAKDGNPKAFHFPRPLLHEGAYDFSFSGLKTAVLREVQKLGIQASRGDGTGADGRSEGARLLDKLGINSLSGRTPNVEVISDLCRCTQDAIIDVLVKKTLKAAEEFDVHSILLSGGVAANETLRKTFEQVATNHKIFVPKKSLCTDNAAMIGAAACFRDEKVIWENVTANPELYFD